MRSGTTRGNSQDTAGLVCPDDVVPNNIRFVEGCSNRFCSPIDARRLFHGNMPNKMSIHIPCRIHEESATRVEFNRHHRVTRSIQPLRKSCQKTHVSMELVTKPL